MIINLADLPLLFIFRSFLFQMNSVISARNATIIPTPSTTYTPSMLVRSIRFGDNTEKLIKVLVRFRDNIFGTKVSTKISEYIEDVTGKMLIENVGYMTPEKLYRDASKLLTSYTLRTTKYPRADQINNSSKYTYKYTEYTLTC